MVCASAKEGLSAFEPGSIDAAVLNSYLEHEREPAAVLAGLWRVLKVGGVAVVKVPNFGSLMRVAMGNEWGGFRFPDHVNYFTLRTLTEMARAASFDVHARLVDRIPTDDNIWAVLIKNTARRQSGSSQTKSGPTPLPP